MTKSLDLTPITTTHYTLTPWYMMSKIFIRNITKSDLEQVCLLHSENEKESFQQSLGFLPGSTDFCRHSFDDPDFDSDLFLGAWEKETLVAWVLGITRPWKAGKEATGFIKWIYVKNSHRNRGIGTQLLSKCERILRTKECKNLLFGSSSPLYFYPGIPADHSQMRTFFKNNGWVERSQRISLSLNLKEIKIGEIKENIPDNTKDSIKLTVAEPDDQDKLIDFISSEFSRSWALETLPAFRSAEKVAFCCYLQCLCTGKIKGFASINTSNPNWFGPMGIGGEFRGFGFGRKLLCYTLSKTQAQGMDHLMIPWVNESAQFYQKVISGMKKHVYFKVEKPL